MLRVNKQLVFLLRQRRSATARMPRPVRQIDLIDTERFNGIDVDHTFINDCDKSQSFQNASANVKRLCSLAYNRSGNIMNSYRETLFSRFCGLQRKPNSIEHKIVCLTADIRVKRCSGRKGERF
ncbi:hypothetical protein ACOME3_005933 [Neoechinorhynchus agilis]